MDNNDSNSKSPQTGGLKLMTVFIFVLALHVLVIGGFTVYHLMSGSGSDADLVLDKTHKLKSDAPDAAPADAVATTAPAASTTTPEKAAQPAPVPVPASAPNPETQTSAPEPSAAPANVPTIAPRFSPTPVAPTIVAVGSKPTPPPVVVINKITPATASSLAPPPDSTTPSGPLAVAPTVSTPATMPSPVTAAPAVPAVPAPVVAGPVHMPDVAPKPTANVASLAESPAVLVTHKETYTVKITDSYKKIAHAHHITVAELKAANHIKGDTLHTGAKLIIPAPKTALAKNDTLSSEPQAVTTNLTTPVASSTSLHHHTYTVEKGDTLTKIAHKFKTSKAALMSENNLTSTSHLAVGRKLKIPSKETRSADVVKPAPAEPSQVQMAPVVQPAPTEEPAPAPHSEPSAELANMSF
jgi:LysM repeat protein